MKLTVRAVGRKECIEFGVVCVCALQVVFIYLRDVEFIYVGIAISTLILTLPRLLYPAAYVWNLLSALLNAIGPAVMLTVVFVVVVTPVALLKRIFGRDIMRRREFGKGSVSALEIRNKIFEAGDFKKMY